MAKENSSTGISWLGLLGLVFIVLKLCNVINWSWWWVTLPLCGGLALVIIGFALYLIFSEKRNW